MSEFFAQDLCNTAWALAQLHVPDIPLLEALSSAAIPNMTQAAPMDISGIAWAFAKIGFCDAPLLESTAAAARPRIG